MGISSPGGRMSKCQYCKVMSQCIGGCTLITTLLSGASSSHNVDVCPSPAASDLLWLNNQMETILSVVREAIMKKCHSVSRLRTFAGRLPSYRLEALTDIRGRALIERWISKIFCFFSPCPAPANHVTSEWNRCWAFLFRPHPSVLIFRLRSLGCTDCPARW